MANITIIGGHGKIALRLIPLLAGAGHTIRAWIRSDAQTAAVEAQGAEAVLLDVEQADMEAMAAALSGCDQLIWSAGAGGGNPSRTYAVDRDAAIRSMQAAAKAEVSRYLMVSYFGASVDHGVPEDNSFFPYAEAKAAADAHLVGSGQAYTIFGPSRLTDEPGTGRIDLAERADASTPGKSEVTRDDVAMVVAQAVSMIDDDHRALLDDILWFNNGATPIGEALRSRPLR